MIEKIRNLWWELSYWLERLPENFWIWLANRLPEKLVYWTVIRATVYASTECYPAEELSSLTSSDILSCWEDN